MTIPTTQQCVDSAIAALESNLGQDVPTYDKSFLRVLAVVLGMNNAELYRFGAQRAKQVLALTAIGDDLTMLGREYYVIRKPETKSVIEVYFERDSSETVTILRSDTVRSRDNGLYYFPVQDYTSPPGDTVITINVRAEIGGASGDLDVSSFMEFASAPEHCSSQGQVNSVVTSGADEETDDALRIRILDEVQSVGGGSNDADYRTWGQRTPNVLRIEPYTGTPPWTGSQPGYRTIYVESVPSYEPDGLANLALRDLVTDYINYDQDTGRRNPCLGSTDDTLDVLSITRNTMHFNVRNLNVEATKTAACQADIETTLNSLARSMHPFVLGLDSEAFRMDVMTPSLASRHVQRIVQAYGGNVGTVDIAMSLGSWIQSWELNPGERLKAEVWYDLT